MDTRIEQIKHNKELLRKSIEELTMDFKDKNPEVYLKCIDVKIFNIKEVGCL